MSSRTSGVIGEQEEISRMGTCGQDATSSEWTDEKHSMYLKSMEASFVQQLYNSIESSGSHSHKKHRLHMRSCNPIESNPTGQRINIHGAEPHTQHLEDRQLLLRNQWIKHFRAPGTENKIVQENTSTEVQPIRGRGRTMYTCGFVNITEHSANAQGYQDSSCSREFSGQNFDDEDNGGGGGGGQVS